MEPVSQYDISNMAASDVYVHACLRYLAGPLHTARFALTGRDDECRLAERTLDTFLRRCLRRAESCLAFGYCAGEVIYSGGPSLDDFRPLHQRDVTPYVDADGRVTDFMVPCAGKPVCLGSATADVPAKGLWLVHGRVFDPVFGRSVLQDAVAPWREKCDLEESIYEKARNGDDSGPLMPKLEAAQRRISDAMGLPRRDTLESVAERAYWLTSELRAQELFAQVDAQIARPLTRMRLGRADYRLAASIDMPAWVRQPVSDTPAIVEAKL